MTRLILASGSPRRKELLSQLGYSFDVVIPNIEECRGAQEAPRDYVMRLAREKAQAGLALVTQERAGTAHVSDATRVAVDANTVVLGSDTIVVVDEQVLEKPRDLSDAKRMLNLLSGREHQVITAVTAVSEQHIASDVVTTQVWFKPLTEQEIEQYWATGEPCDKAGGYGIQGLGGRFVTRIAGSYFAVMGLPLYETEQLLSQFYTV
ncbi:septum formation inhibitor Maf [Vibrio sp. SM6]|uniref:dTTP/UTP pyrophosphatase n=2 Tax=Vibrio agarilyticus TaxID=2726741 RepID=A0A7X8TU15_9VIBR|nr:septum formation inhibitor Maf [Vibrio agarilyticus]